MVTYYQIVQAYRGVVTAARTLDYAKRFSSAQVLNFKPNAVLMEGEHAPIEVGTRLRVLHVRQFAQSTKDAKTFGEFRALVYTDDYRCTWIHPYEIAIELPPDNDTNARLPTHLRNVKLEQI